MQVNKTNDAKLQCIENQINGIFPDREKFYAAYLSQAERLLDSRKYTKECEMLKVPAENVAEHIVFSGSAMINKVLKYGVENTLGKGVKLYKDELISSKIKDAVCNETVSNPVG